MGRRAPALRLPVLRMIAGALLCGATPALAIQASAPAAAQPAAPAAPALFPAAPAVDSYYAARGNAPIWLRDAASFEAARLLPAILRRARVDGLADSAELARRVEDALARAARSPLDGKPGAFSAEEKLLSAAWVQYVRALNAPVPGMLYGDPALAPKPPPPERILIDARKATSLAGHVKAIAAVNPLYAQLREVALANLGDGAPDPRLAINLQRARLLPPVGRYALVNAATAQLWLYEDGRLVDSMKVVVGQRETPTPMLAGTIHYVTFNPYWNIPEDVARRVVAPLVLKRGTAYLRAAEYEVASEWTAKATVVPPDEVDWKAVAAGTTGIRLRQLPGPNNMMGAIKFGFANDQGIYLHDTPQKNLFAKERRTYSLGCVRVEDAQRFARWLLGREPVAPSSEPEQHVQLAAGVPIYITYLTALPDSGRLAFAEDVYGLDPKPAAALTAAAPATVAAGPPVDVAPDTAASPATVATPPPVADPPGR